MSLLRPCPSLEGGCSDTRLGPRPLAETAAELAPTICRGEGTYNTICSKDHGCLSTLLSLPTHFLFTRYRFWLYMTLLVKHLWGLALENIINYRPSAMRLLTGSRQLSTSGRSWLLIGQRGLRAPIGARVTSDFCHVRLAEHHKHGKEEILWLLDVELVLVWWIASSSVERNLPQSSWLASTI